MLNSTISLIALIAISTTACTKPNPLDCSDGTCTDPTHPFCDVDGTLGGDTPQSCVAVTCTPGIFAACRGDSALTCNAAGTSYDLTQCSDGCAPGIGCRLCEANQTVCANGTVQTCDADGEVTVSQTCTLGCFEDQPRCREFAPSNALGAYMDMAAMGPDVVLESTTLYVPMGKYDTHSLTSVVAPGAGSSPSIEVFPVRSLTVHGAVYIQRDSLSQSAAPAIAFVVYGDVDISGALIIQGAGAETTPPPGSIVTGDCVGTTGKIKISSSLYTAGSGGGGSATKGGDGGVVSSVFPASAGGSAISNPDLQPLTGGCAGGTPQGFINGYGGGAIQISSRTIIHLAPNAAIHADGHIGYAPELPIDYQPYMEAIPGGGGGGGSILLEAPAVNLDSAVILTANGGGGTSGDLQKATSPSGSTPSRGGVCDASEPPSYCSNGGNGGSSAGLAINGVSLLEDDQEVNTGGGGGSIGTIRINTATGYYTQANDAFTSPAPSAGTIGTR